jgi:hypothetical protein
MNEPVTELDPRFSDPDAVPTSWPETRRILESAELFWICTVRADGRPHVTPLVAVWLDGHRVHKFVHAACWYSWSSPPSRSRR